MITVTDKARNKIKEFLERRGKGVGIRIGVKTSGCSGLKYVLEFVDEYTAEPHVINYAQQDFVVLVDQKHDIYMFGMEIDWVKNGLNEGFDFKNPNETARCGCGESFKV
jgi:iron-sulfur cluster assembly protein